MKRMKKLTVATVGLVGLFTAAALAWFVLGNIEGIGVTHSGKTTPTVVPVKVLIHEGVTPTQEEPFEALTIENPSSNAKEIEVQMLHFTITDASEVACPASNFSIVGVSGFEIVKLMKGEPYVPHFALVGSGVSLNLIGPEPSGYHFNLKMAATAPEGCENVEVKVKVKVN